MPDNPYLVVGSPSYAGPLLDFSALDPSRPRQGQQQQGQQGQGQPRPGQPNNPAANLGTGIRNFWQGLQPYLQPNQPQTYQPNGPMMIAPQIGSPTFQPGQSGGAVY